MQRFKRSYTYNVFIIMDMDNIMDIMDILSLKWLKCLNNIWIGISLYNAYLHIVKSTPSNQNSSPMFKGNEFQYSSYSLIAEPCLKINAYSIFENPPPPKYKTIRPITHVSFSKFCCKSTCIQKLSLQYTQITVYR